MWRRGRLEKGVPLSSGFGVRTQGRGAQASELGAGKLVSSVPLDGNISRTSRSGRRRGHLRP